MSQDGESDSDGIIRLAAAPERDFKLRKVVVKQSTCRTPLQIWTMNDIEARMTDLDNNYESLKIIVGAIPHPVASAPEIEDLVMRIDEKHRNLLSASQDKTKTTASGVL